MQILDHQHQRMAIGHGAEERQDGGEGPLAPGLGAEDEGWIALPDGQ